MEWFGSVGHQITLCDLVATLLGMSGFYRQFPSAQQDNIEVRICTDQNFADESVSFSGSSTTCCAINNNTVKTRVL